MQLNPHPQSRPMIDLGTLEELPRRAADLARLVEIGEALNSSVELDEILNMILIGVTAGQGLRFNRAFLLLIDEESRTLRGKLAIGPENAEEASRVWQDLEDRRLTLKEMMLTYRSEVPGAGRRVTQILEALKVPLEEGGHVLVRALRPETGAGVVRRSECDDGTCSKVAETLGVDEFALVPILSRGGSIGVLVADNAITHRPIDAIDLDILRLFTGHAGTAIEKARLYSRLVEEKNELETMHLELRRNQQTIIELQRLSDLGEMTARMAHELRNPLVSIGGFARRLLAEAGLEDPRRRHLQIIVDEVVRLETILTEVLDYARPLRPKAVRTDLNQLVRETLELVAPEREGLGVDLALDLDDSLGHVPLDAGLFRIALVNLIRNGLQAIPRKGGRSGRITVRTKKNGALAEVSVMDNGTGIPSDAVERIFEPFFTTKVSGSGLGLPIVSQILREHGGRVRVESHPGEGAAFHLDLPIEKGSAS